MREYLNTNGSVWNKWDLHVHSPASKLHNEFGEWDEYLQTLESLSDISVLGITDYYSIEGYLKVKKYQETGRLQNIKLVLPNVELRIDTVTTRDRPVNLHIIFSPEVIGHIEDKFFRELKYEYGGRTFSCIQNDLIELGKMANSTLKSDEAALKEGMNQFKVSISKLEEVLQQNRSIFNGNYLTIVANKETDGASGLRDSSMRMEQQKIYHFADAIFSSRANDRKFFLGQADAYPKEMIIERFGSLKPCIHGSDAHKIEKICKPDLNRFTWIKADPSFQGLLQIIHEPEHRVMIQENHPDSKSDYNIIDSVSFIGSDFFSDNEIKLNPGLNTIIGGKSSGKSLLLYKIAQAVSNVEIESRSNENHWKNPYISSFIEDEDFIVKWRNGDNSIPSSNKGRVTYIPQMYINSLSEETADYDLQEKIKEIIIQKEENATFLSEKRDSIIGINSVMRQEIVKMFEKIDELEVICQEIEKTGTKDTIEQELNRLNILIDEKIANSSLSKQDEMQMKVLEKQSKEIDSFIVLQQNNIKNTDNTTTELNIFLDEIKLRLKGFSTNLNEENLSIIDNLHSEIVIAVEKTQIALEENKSNLSVGEQENLLKKIEDLTSRKNLIKEEINQLKDNLFINSEKCFNLLCEIKVNFKDKEVTDSLILATNIIFDQIKFKDSFLSLFNRRGRITNIFPNTDQIQVFNEDDELVFHEHNYINTIKYLINCLLLNEENKLKLKQSFTKQQAVDALLNTTFTRIIFDLNKDGDSLQQMSPGKRGLVLLELFLGLSEEKHPILIDQPEDNLDNRTISKELVKFVKLKKINRQIVIVTHNANLVVLTDSENVIVANQDQLLEENHSHRFEYISGALECDFTGDPNNKMTSKGIKSHVCEILEGGQEAFEIREKKYGF